MNNHHLFIENRMKELGFENYHAQSLKLDIEAGQSVQHIKAHNEYLYLINESIPGDLIIHSDSNLFFSAVQQSNSYIPEEFSGLVCIESSGMDAFSLEFIRVIPN